LRILQEHYGVPATSVTYRTGGLHAPGRVEKLPLSLPDDIRVEPIGVRQTLAQMPVAGEVAGTRRLLGDDYWPYGVPPNQRALETFLRYSHEQGLARRPLRPAELFAPETLEDFVT
jgi:hypothetical protein